MRFSLIAAPLELGCGTTGCAMGGAALVSGENGLLSFLTHNGISASADSAFVPMTARREEEPAPHYLPEVVTACCATRDAVSAAQGEGAFPVTLGGDHALGLGTVAGTAQHYSPEELSLVWVDAHTDINTENSSLSGNIHGMPIAALLGLCGQELSSVCGGLPVLRPENVHIIFARDIDPAEERIIAEQGVHLYRMSEIKEQGLSAVLHRLLGNITTPFCHVSWDVDSLDASFIPATGLPIPDGPDPKAVTDVLLALAASAEAKSEHPLGKAIVAHARAKGLSLQESSRFSMAAGRGVYAEVAGRRLLCGSERFLEANGATVGEAACTALEKLRSQGKASILVAQEEKCVGVIALSDVIRPEARNMVSRLRSMGADTVLLTGDNQRTANYFAKQAGIAEVRAELLPENKVNAIEALQTQGHTVCMIGDGVNDAPALKTADVSVAMGSMGSDIAVEAADIALVDDEVKELPHLMALSRRMMSTIRMNLTFSMGLNFLSIVLAMAGTLNPVVGALVHNAGSVAVILNSALLLKWRRRQG